MSYLDPDRPPEERIQEALAHGPDVNAQGRFGVVTRAARKLVGRAVKYERDFNLQIDAALLQRLHEIEGEAQERIRALEQWARESIEHLRESTDRAREVSEQIGRRVDHELSLLAGEVDEKIAGFESCLDDLEGRAAIANAVATGAMQGFETVNHATSELGEQARFAYEELTAKPYVSDVSSISYTDAKGRVQLGYRDANGRAVPVYAGFEALFRGPEQLVRDRQRVYLDVIGRRGPVVDLGCGRGEMLQLLSEAGLDAVGVDLDEAMVERSRVFADVHHGDALDFLVKQDDASLGVIFSAQFIEHLPTALLPELFEVARAKLKPDGLFIAETVNPHSPRALKAFWLDPTHRHPLFPETLVALCRFTGFESARIMFPLGHDDVSDDLRTRGEYAVIAGAHVGD